MFKFILDEPSQHGIFNGVAPQQVTNMQMMQAIAKGLHKSIRLPNVPKFVLKLIYGEMSIVILEGSQVSAEKIVKAGFKFDYDTIDIAVNNLNSK
jgi:NAD dependent epimerase/dehydratase family enzyme